MSVLKGEENRYLWMGTAFASHIYNGLVQRFIALADIEYSDVIYGVVSHFSIIYILVKIGLP
ncbi:hypothetical protein D3C77_654340 [compost metagenome]